jgi:hypothetical protein
MDPNLAMTGRFNVRTIGLAVISLTVKEGCVMANTIGLLSGPTRSLFRLAGVNVNSLMSIL